MVSPDARAGGIRDSTRRLADDFDATLDDEAEILVRKVMFSIDLADKLHELRGMVAHIPEQAEVGLLRPHRLHVRRARCFGGGMDS